MSDIEMKIPETTVYSIFSDAVANGLLCAPIFEKLEAAQMVTIKEVSMSPNVTVIDIVDGSGEEMKVVASYGRVTSVVKTKYKTSYRGVDIVVKEGLVEFKLGNKCYSKSSISEAHIVIDELKIAKDKVFEPLLKESGMSNKAVRSLDADSVAYHLISPFALARLAATYREGSSKYGDFNWTKGFPIGDCLNHAIRHLNYYLAGDRSEDHLAHAAWNLFTVMHYEHTNPSLVLHKYSEQAKGILDSIKAPKVEKHT